MVIRRCQGQNPFFFPAMVFVACELVRPLRPRSTCSSCRRRRGPMMPCGVLPSLVLTLTLLRHGGVWSPKLWPGYVVVVVVRGDVLGCPCPWPTFVYLRYGGWNGFPGGRSRCCGFNVALVV